MLDLRFATGRGGLTLAACHFRQAPYLEHARLDKLNFDGSRLPGQRAPHLELSGALFLKGTEITAPLFLTEARIGGQLNCVGAKLDGNGRAALNGQGMRVVGELIFREVEKTAGDGILAAAQVGALADDVQSWRQIGGTHNLDGFTYDRVFGTMDMTDRL